MERLGKYEIRGVLGRGAMGTVYDGWDPHIARRVAIKTVRLPDSADSEERERHSRFQQEAQAAGRLQHPNIVGVFDYAETDELAYIVMEYVNGRTLKSMLDSGMRPGLDEIGQLMSGLLTGLDHSHGHQVIHRDIKPANVIVTPANTVKIADFGIARIGGSGMTLAGAIMGTPAYMSPEQFKGTEIDVRTDIYSAGVVLFQLLTGKRPFEGGMATIMHAVLNEPAPRPSATAGDISPALDAVTARAMARAPCERFQDAAEFNRALQAALRSGAFPVPAGSGGLPPGLGDLPGDEATVVRPNPAQQARPGHAKPASAVEAAAKTPPGPSSRSRTGLVLAGVAALLAVGGAAYLLLGHGSSVPPFGPGPLAAIAPSPSPAQPEHAPDPVPKPESPAAPLPAPPPAVTPAPSSPPLDPAPPQPVPQLLPLAAVAAALRAAPCTAIGGEERPPGALTLRGVSGPAAAHALRDAVQKAAPSVSVDWQLAIAEGPFCEILDLLRPYVRPPGSAAASVGVALLDGRVALVKDEYMIPRVTMPESYGHLQLDYVSNDGGVVHIHQAAAASRPYPPGAAPVFGRPDANERNFPVDEPYGTDLIAAIASSAPMFRAVRPEGEALDTYLRELRTALDQAVRNGVRVSAAFLLVRTAAR